MFESKKEMIPRSCVNAEGRDHVAEKGGALGKKVLKTLDCTGRDVEKLKSLRQRAPEGTGSPRTTTQPGAKKNPVKKKLPEAGGNRRLT